MMGSIAAWLYVRYHHQMVTSGLSTIDCGTWHNRSFNDSACLTAFAGLDLAYVLSILGFTCGAAYFTLAFVRTLRRVPIFARGTDVLLRAVGPRDAKAFAATIDADVIVENRMPFDVARTVRRLVRSHAARPYLAIYETRTERLVGAIVDTPDLATMEMNFGIWIGADYRGKGYATQAIAAHAAMLHRRGFVRVIAETSIDNRAMRAALAHAGFVPTDYFIFTFPNDDSIRAVRYVSKATFEPAQSATHATKR